MAPQHFVGDKVRLTCAVKDIDGAAADPTALTVIVKPPLAAASSYVWPDDVEVVKVETGLFYYEPTTGEAGVHQVRWVATGAIVKAAQTSFNVTAVNAP